MFCMGDITLRKVLEEYETIFLASRNFAPRTRVEYLNDIEDLIQFLERVGVHEVKDIGIQLLERYLAELDRRGNAGSTRKRKIISIRSFLWYLYQDQYIRINLAKKLIPPFSQPKIPRFLTETEMERLLSVSKNNLRDFAIIQILLQTGIKLAEICRLTVGDVQISRSSWMGMESPRFLRVSGGERQKERLVPLNLICCQALENYMSERTFAVDQMLFANRFGEGLGARGIEKILKRYYGQTGIRSATVHSLRHTFGVYHALNGTDPKTIQATMGHKDSRSTLIYVAMASNLRQPVSSY